MLAPAVGSDGVWHSPQFVLRIMRALSRSRSTSLGGGWIATRPDADRKNSPATQLGIQSHQLVDDAGSIDRLHEEFARRLRAAGIAGTIPIDDVRLAIEWRGYLSPALRLL